MTEMHSLLPEANLVSLNSFSRKVLHPRACVNLEFFAKGQSVASTGLFPCLRASKTRNQTGCHRFTEIGQIF